MDITYLLWWQDFRNLIGDALTPFMEAVSLFAVTYLIIIPVMIYWCINKRSGLFILSSYSLSGAFNAVLKLTVCAYRPWIRDSRIVPAGDAITTATGYSFPSGHTIRASASYGGIAVTTWKKLRWISYLCFAFIAVTAISRNYLGVHTPQDVLVALIEGFAALFVIQKIFVYLEKHPEKEDIFLIAGVLIGIASICYITLKPYPMDYVNGELLVDPLRMMKDGYGDIGFFIGFCLGRFIDKKWVKFEPEWSKETLAAGIAGSVILFFMIQLLGSPLKEWFGLRWGALANNVIIVMFIMVIWPLVLKAVKKKHQEALR